MDANKLSQRLLHVAQYVPGGARLADIGSDHAYLPVYLAKKGLISYAVAGEVAAGPHKNASRVIAHADMDDIVHSRLADGLEAYSTEDAIDTITICGMGGPLIVSILKAGADKLKNAPLLILQPNVGACAVRKWIQDHSYLISQEEILKEDKHIYEIIVAQPDVNTHKLSVDELAFGPFLMHRKEPAFVEKWTQELQRSQKVLRALKHAKRDTSTKFQEVSDKIAQIKGVLVNDDS